MKATLTSNINVPRGVNSDVDGQENAVSSNVVHRPPQSESFGCVCNLVRQAFATARRPAPPRRQEHQPLGTQVAIEMKFATHGATGDTANRHIPGELSQS